MAAQAALDVYGFELDLTPEEMHARQACDAKQQARAAKWEPYFKARKLPPAAKLKKYCREVQPRKFCQAQLLFYYSMLLQQYQSQCQKDAYLAPELWQADVHLIAGCWPLSL